jgi:hypothetical protein
MHWIFREGNSRQERKMVPVKALYGGMRALTG